MREDALKRLKELEKENLELLLSSALPDPQIEFTRHLQKSLRIGNHSIGKILWVVRDEFAAFDQVKIWIARSGSDLFAEEMMVTARKEARGETS